MRNIFRLILVLLLGYYIMEWWLNQQKQATVPAPVKVTPPVKPQAPSSPSSHSSDPLTELDGIGPAYERALNTMGIRTFAQLAAQNPEELAAGLSSVRVTAARIKRDQWIEQAATRANLPVSSSRWSGNDGNSA
jgi:predicted flap endonuclease-1-like 5' DNA nuclease